jgi:hypothetical protein
MTRLNLSKSDLQLFPIFDFNRQSTFGCILPRSGLKGNNGGDNVLAWAKRYGEVRHFSACSKQNYGE